jgi:hypothetical protein
MNMVSLLALPLVIQYNLKDGFGNPVVGACIAVIAVLAVGWAWWQSKQESAQLKELDAAMMKESVEATPKAG